MPKHTLPAPARYGLFAAACLILALQAGLSRMLKVDEVSLQVPGLHQLPWDFGKWKAFDPQQRINFPAVRNIGNIMVEEDDISSVPSMDALFDTSYLAEAAK